MAGKKKKGGEGEHENSERWLLTYADMITLLVAFFIMLYSMSVMNQAKFQQLAISVRSGFGESSMNGVPTIFSRGGGLNATPSIMNSSKAGADVQRRIYQKRESPAGRRRFGQSLRGSQSLHPEEPLAGHDAGRKERARRGCHGDDRQNAVRAGRCLSASRRAGPIEHGGLGLPVPSRRTQSASKATTDSLPIHTERFPSNWELSVTRATTVLRYFESRGVAARRLEASGYADQRPLAANDTEAHRAQNRRVEIVLLRRFAPPAGPVPVQGQ